MTWEWTPSIVYIFPSQAKCTLEQRRELEASTQSVGRVPLYTVCQDDTGSPAPRIDGFSSATVVTVSTRLATLS